MFAFKFLIIIIGRVFFVTLMFIVMVVSGFLLILVLMITERFFGVGIMRLLMYIRFCKVLMKLLGDFFLVIVIFLKLMILVKNLGGRGLLIFICFL